MGSVILVKPLKEIVDVESIAGRSFTTKADRRCWEPLHNDFRSSSER